jgi:hypothetical protein
MATAFTKFLHGIGSGLLGEKQPFMRDYQHAHRLYVQDNYARAPKVGFTYFLAFNLTSVAKNMGPLTTWNREGLNSVGLLVKKCDLPKFSITTETMNQYNRKTVVQTKMKYNSINIDFHDDNRDITTGLWERYYRYYYDDAHENYKIIKKSGGPGEQKQSLTEKIKGAISGKFRNQASNEGIVAVPQAFEDVKYISGDQYNFNYGISPIIERFFSTIDIYVLHQHRFTQYTLVNPMITDWSHDSLDNADGTKLLGNKMTIAYESVLYNHGKIKKGTIAHSFAAVYYDNTPSPLSLAGGGGGGLFGVLGGAGDVFSSFASGNFLGGALQAVNLVKNAKKLTTDGIKQELTGAAISVITNPAVLRPQPGSSAQQTTSAIGGIGLNPSAPTTFAAPRAITPPSSFPTF